MFYKIFFCSKLANVLDKADRKKEKEKKNKQMHSVMHFTQKQ